MELPTQLLASVTHFDFGIFNIALPNIIALFVLVTIFISAAWARLPRIFESESE
jgi:hypothetical protein